MREDKHAHTPPQPHAAAPKKSVALSGVPAGNTAHPLRWTPGISTGPLKVITVFRFHSSAFASGENTAPISARPNTVVVTVLKILICCFSFLLWKSVRPAFRSCWTPCLAALGWPVAHGEEKHSEVHRILASVQGRAYRRLWKRAAGAARAAIAGRSAETAPKEKPHRSSS